MNVIYVPINYLINTTAVHVVSCLIIYKSSKILSYTFLNIFFDEYFLLTLN